MEQTRHLQPQDLAKLIRKLRWIGMEAESRHLQMAMFSLPPHERYAVFWRDHSAPTKHCPFRKFRPAEIRMVIDNYRIIESDVCYPARARNVCRRSIQVADPVLAQNSAILRDPRDFCIAAIALRFVRVNGDSGDIHPAALKMDEKQHVVGHQPAQRQHLRREKIGPRQQRQVGPNEGRPCGRALALRRRRQTVTLQNIADRLIGILYPRLAKAPAIRS